MTRRARALSFSVSALLWSTSATASPRLELELGAGATQINELNPTFDARLGLDLMGWLTPSLRLMSLTPLSAQAMGWSVLGEIRAHTKGTVQLTGGVALGFATASFNRRAGGAVDAQVADVAPYLWADVGLRVFIGPFWIGAAVAGAPLNLQLMGLLNVGVALFG